jgi:hypothetical protein
MSGAEPSKDCDHVDFHGLLKRMPSEVQTATPPSHQHSWRPLNIPVIRPSPVAVSTLVNEKNNSHHDHSRLFKQSMYIFMRGSTYNFQCLLYEVRVHSGPRTIQQKR